MSSLNKKLLLTAYFFLTLDAASLDAESLKPQEASLAARAHAVVIGKVDVPMIASAKPRIHIPKGSKIAVMKMTHPESVPRDCSEAVSNAVMRRLLGYSDYDLVTRNYIKGVLDEQDFSWGTSVDTRTASELGKLLGADVLIFGRVDFCSFTLPGQIQLPELPHVHDGEQCGCSVRKKQWIHFLAQQMITGKIVSRIYAFINVIDVETGRLLLSTGHEETASKRQYLLSTQPDPGHLQAQAADQIAGDLLDKILSRPEFFVLELFGGNAWAFKKGIRYIRFGDCVTAERHFSNSVENLLPWMKDRAAGRMLHNQGVSLLCSNRPERAVKKFLASYRIIESKASLRMMDLANRLAERDLQVWREEDPVVRKLVERME